MIVGILREIKEEENRVSMTPAGVEVTKKNGHTVLVEKAAGVGSSFEDETYLKAGESALKWLYKGLFSPFLLSHFID